MPRAVLCIIQIVIPLLHRFHSRVCVQILCELLVIEPIILVYAICIKRHFLVFAASDNRTMLLDRLDGVACVTRGIDVCVNQVLYFLVVITRDVIVLIFIVGIPTSNLGVMIK